MATGSSIELRRRLVEHLRRRGCLVDSRIAKAFLMVPREVFLPEHAVRLGTPAVYRDEAIVVRRDPASGAPQSSSSQPAIMALMLEMLDARPGQRILEIGAGTGYNAALLDRLTRPDGLVVTVDIDAAAAAGAAAALGRLGARVHVAVADGAAGFPTARADLFDGIVVTASSETVPHVWYEQLAPGGRLVVPLRLSAVPDSAHAITVLRKATVGFDSVGVTCGGFMPLRHVAGSSSDQGDEPEASVEEPAPAAAAPSAPEQVREPLQQHFMSGFGPPFDLGREAVERMHIAVRYGDKPPSAQWVLERDGHWIAVDLAGA